MTYQQLMTEIRLAAALNPSILKQDATVYVRGVDEFYPISDRLFEETESDSVLDKGSLYMQI